MMKYNVLPDGSQKYEHPIRISTHLWRYRNNDLTHVEPVVPVCVKRRIELRVLQCGRVRDTWHCDTLKKVVTVKDCNECKIPTSVSQPSQS